MKNIFRSKFINQNYGETPYPWDTIIMESPNFYAIPSVGSLVPGWLLIVPKESVICMGALEENKLKELDIFLHEVADMIM